MASHLININSWEMMKRVFGVAFQFVWLFIKYFWWVFLILIAIKILPILLERLIRNRKNSKRFKAGQVWRSDRDLIYWLRGMKPTEFEHYIAELFSALGFKTETVGGSYDGGVDVIAEKDGFKHYIQCKKFITQQVSVGAVRDFYGAIADHLAKGKGYFITTNKFTLEAEQFAQDKPIELIDSFNLIRYIRSVEKASDKESGQQKSRRRDAKDKIIKI